MKFGEEVMIEYALAICIPTYNRKNNIVRQVEFFQKYKEYFTEERIQIVVSDNASDYDFLSVMKERPKFVDIYRSTSNIGFNGNLLNAIKGSNAKYIMFMGDDDYIQIEGLIQIINCIKISSPDGIIANYALRIKNRRNNILAIPYLKDCTNTCLSDVMQYINEKITFMSSMIIKRELLDQNIGKYATLANSKYFMHVDLLFYSLGTSSKINISAKPIVLASDENKISYDVQELFSDDLGRIIIANKTTVKKKSTSYFYFKILYFIVNADKRRRKQKYDLHRFSRAGFPKKTLMFLSICNLNWILGIIIIKIINKIVGVYIELKFYIFWKRHH
jgi:hypothetical protein